MDLLRPGRLRRCEIERIERGWIYVDGRRSDDGTLQFGTGTSCA